MNKRGTGTIFCLIAALLFLGKYITVAILISNVNGFSTEIYDIAFKYTGTPLVVLSVLSLIIGIVYLVWAEKLEKK